MKKTFITSMPDESGAFLKASRIIAQHDANITRVSYNRGVDAHLLFLDVSGSAEQLESVSKELETIGYIPDFEADASVLLLEFKLHDEPGAVLPVLELIHDYSFNITYISSHETETPYQYFRMGILIEDSDLLAQFLDRAAEICDVSIIEYDHSEKSLDNTVFYINFVNDVSNKLALTLEETQELMIQSNLLMQQLDERDELPQKTFEYIGKFAILLSAYKGDAFTPRISQYQLEDDTKLHIIEPPCGSNTYILETKQSLLFVDSGFACYKEEMLYILRELVESFDSKQRELLLTHPDIDHSGLLPLFKKVYVTEEAKEHFVCETEGKPNYREMNPAHAPYSRISRILSKYSPADISTLVSISGEHDTSDGQPIEYLASRSIMGLTFDIYRGNGGHVTGEAIFVNELNKLVFCGDIVVNPEGFTREQYDFNQLAPYLMTSVNMDSHKAKLARSYLLEHFDPAEYTYCCGHGALMRGSALSL